MCRNVLWRKLGFLGATLLLSVIFTSAARAQLTNIQYTTATDGNGGVIITKFSASGSGPLSIPATIMVNGSALPVTAIAADAFYGASLTSLVIPSGVTSIGLEAFGENFTLASVTIPNTVTTIGQAAFENNALTSVTIPNSVTSLGEGVFDECGSLTHVTIGNNVARIEDYTFYDCTSLTSITIGNHVTSIGFGAFQNCKLASVTIPASVTTIHDQAFFNCTSLATVSFGTGLTSIGVAAFETTKLSSVTISANVTHIGQNAFTSCPHLTAINVAAQNTVYSSVGGVLFNPNQTALIAFPGGLTGSYTIPSSVITVESFAFFSCAALTSVTIPTSVTNIGDQAFEYCTGLGSVTIPASVFSLGRDTFYGCSSLTSVVFLGNAPAMTGYDFLAAAGSFTVSYYDGATGFTAPTWIPPTTDINESYPSVNLGAPAAPIPALVSNASPFTVKPDYTGGLTITGYTGPGGAVIIPSTVTINGVTYPVTGLGATALANQTSLTSVTIPDSVTSIGAQTFAACTHLVSVNMGNGVSSIGYDAFETCTGLTSIVIGSGVTDIGFAAFQNCSALTKVTIPNGVTTLEGEAFTGCTSLTNVVIPASVTKLGGFTFQADSSLISAVFLGNAPSLNGDDFDSTASGFAAYYYSGAAGFTSPTWGGYAAANLGNINDGISLGGNLALGLVTIHTTVTTKMAIVNPGHTPITVSSISYPAGFSGDWASGTIPPNSAQIVTVTSTPTVERNYGGNITVNSNAPVPAKSIAASGYGVNPAPFTIVSDGNGGVTISGYTGTGGSVVIPASISGLAVTSIGSNAFYNRSSITSLTLPEGLTSIGTDAFIYCGGINTLRIPKSVTTISSFAFYDCIGLSNLTIGGGVTNIGLYAFYGCASLGLATFEGNAPTMGGNVFASASRNGFKVAYYQGITGFTSPTWTPDSLDSYPVFAIQQTSPALFTSTSDGNNGEIITGYTGSVTNVIMPSSLEGQAITGIGANVFANKTALTSVTIIPSVATIGNDAFKNCTGLTQLTIPASVTSLGHGAFENCSQLAGALFLGSAPTMGGNVFSGAAPGFTVSYYTDETNFSAPVWSPDATDSYASIGLSPYGTEAITGGGFFIANYIGHASALVIPSTINGQTVTGIAAGAFRSGTLTSVTIPSSVTTLDQLAFYGCTNLTSAIFLGNAPSVGTILGAPIFDLPSSSFRVYYSPGATGFTPPTWNPDPYDSYTTALIPVPYAQWALAKGIAGSAAATPQKDGVPNLLKYLYDINPASPMTPSDRSALPTVGTDTTTNPGTQYLCLTYRENPSMTGVTVNVQTSTNLQTWTTVTPDITHQVGTDATTGDPIMEHEVNTNGAAKEYVRLHVMTSP